MAINLGDNSAEAAWRKEVREFIKNETPAAMRQAGGDAGGEGALFARGRDAMGAMLQWRNKIIARGWIAPA